MLKEELIALGVWILIVLALLLAVTITHTPRHNKVGLFHIVVPVTVKFNVDQSDQVAK